MAPDADCGITAMLSKLNAIRAAQASGASGNPPCGVGGTSAGNG